MTHTFNLNHPDKKASPVRIVVSHGGKVYRRSAALSIETRLWNQKARRLSAMCKDAQVYVRLAEIDARLKDRERTAVTELDVLNAIEYALYGENARVITAKKVRPTFWEHFKNWADRDMPSRRFRQLAYRRVGEIMGMMEDWEEVDAAYYHRFILKMNDAGYSNNYKSTLSAKIRSVLYEGKKLGYHDSEAYKAFKHNYETADTIALTEDEVERLWNAELAGRAAEARDVFIVGIFSAARFQDYSKLSADNISDGTLRYVQRKTAHSVVIPCSPKIAEVFGRYGGRLPKITEQEVGRYIKEICRNLGGSFSDTVEISVSKGARKVIEKHPRWELVSTHTARRTGATLLYLIYKVPIRQCMMLTGHTTEANFRKYIRIGAEENARLLADNPFFQ